MIDINQNFMKIHLHILKKELVRKKLRKDYLYIKKKIIIDKIDKKFLVEKELLLSLMGIETNFGKYLGKMDIISSLATLSFDKRRSEFFTNELLILLRLIDKGIIKKYYLVHGLELLEIFNLCHKQ